MTEQAQPAFQQDWLKAQQEYWQAWQRLSQEAFQRPGQPGEYAQNWGKALDLWWQAVGEMAPAESREVFGKFVEQGKEYFRFQETFLKALQDNAGQAGAKSWQDMLAQMRDQFGKLGLAGLPAGWESPLQEWQKFMAQMGQGMEWLKNADWMKNLAQPPWQGMMEDHVRKLLSAPGVGYGREMQDSIQTAMRLGLDYDKAQRDYMALFNTMSADIFERMGKKLEALDKKGTPVTELRALYDLWVDCGEDSYAELVKTEEYGKRNAQLSNAMMALKRQVREMMDGQMALLGLPSRQELNSMQQSFHQLRREVRELRAELEAMKSGNSAAAPQPAAAKSKPAAKGKGE